jgi:mRNA interferase MazF
MVKIERYQLYWAELDPTRGSEIAKTRPVIIVSPSSMNDNIDTVVVCPLTSQIHAQWPSRVACMVGTKPGEIAVDQIRTLSKSRLGKLIGKVESATAAQVRQVIQQLYATV